MGLGYTFQNVYDVLGSRDTSDDSLTTVNLSATYTATNTKILPTGGMSKITYDISYTNGTGESGTKLVIKVEFSPDRTNFYHSLNDSTSGATTTLTEREFEFTNSSTATNKKISLPIDIYDRYAKIWVKETGVSSNVGTIYAGATLNGAK